jgi:hypothetical protein
MEFFVMNLSDEKDEDEAGIDAQLSGVWLSTEAVDGSTKRLPVAWDRTLKDTPSGPGGTQASARHRRSRCYQFTHDLFIEPSTTAIAFNIGERQLDRVVVQQAPPPTVIVLSDTPIRVAVKVDTSQTTSISPSLVTKDGEWRGIRSVPTAWRQTDPKPCWVEAVLPEDRVTPSEINELRLHVSTAFRGWDFVYTRDSNRRH